MLQDHIGSCSVSTYIPIIHFVFALIHCVMHISHYHSEPHISRLLILLHIILLQYAAILSCYIELLHWAATLGCYIALLHIILLHWAATLSCYNMPLHIILLHWAATLSCYILCCHILCCYIEILYFATLSCYILCRYIERQLFSLHLPRLINSGVQCSVSSQYGRCNGPMMCCYIGSCSAVLHAVLQCSVS